MTWRTTGLFGEPREAYIQQLSLADMMSMMIKLVIAVLSVITNSESWSLKYITGLLSAGLTDYQ